MNTKFFNKLNVMRSSCLFTKAISVILALGFSLLSANSYAATLNVACNNAALISAIDIANGNAEPDELILANSCVYSLSSSNNSSNTGGANGLPIISSDITITGNDSIIERSTAAIDRFRFFQTESTGKLTLIDLTLQGGHGVNGNSNFVAINGFFLGTAPGGGAILTAGDLDILRVNLLNNRTGDGSSDQSLTSPSGGSGGAISSIDESEVIIRASTIDGNQTGNAFFDNPPGAGGALSINGSSVLIDRSTVSNNRIGDTQQSFGATSATIIDAFPDTSFILRRSTISGNGIGQSEPGIFFNSSLDEVEISQNTFFNSNFGSATFLSINAGTNAVIVRHNIFEGNGNSCFVNASDLNVSESSGNIFDGTTSICGVNVANNNIIGTTAGLLPLAFNGGITRTHDLPANSPARDQITNPISGLVYDQRGYIEFGQDGGVARGHTPVDIGAVEAIAVTAVSDNFTSTDNMLLTGQQQDWYSVHLEEGDSIEYTVNFSNATGDVDTLFFSKDRLFSFDLYGDDFLGNSESISDIEFIEFTATEEGEYWFVVYGYIQATNVYDMNLKVTRNESCFPIKASNGNLAVVCL